MLETDIAYAAGLVDGEGTIGVYMRGKGSVRFKVAVYNTEYPMMEWLQLRFGGKIHRVGKIRAGRKQEYAWYKSDNEFQEFLSLVLPYLVTKRLRAELALKAWHGRGEVSREVRRQGVPVELINRRLGLVAAVKGA